MCLYVVISQRLHTYSQMNTTFRTNILGSPSIAWISGAPGHRFCMRIQQRLVPRARQVMDVNLNNCLHSFWGTLRRLFCRLGGDQPANSRISVKSALGWLLRVVEVLSHHPGRLSVLCAVRWQAGHLVMIDIIRGWDDPILLVVVPPNYMSTTIVWYINCDIPYYVQASCTIALVAVPPEAAITITPSTKPR